MISRNAVLGTGAVARWVSLGLMAVGLSACGTNTKPVDALTTTLTPYKVDILQGNVLTQEQVRVLQVGMSREQVRDILGTPLLTSVFHANRWDYVFTLKSQGQAPQRRQFSVFFEGAQLVRFGGDDVPSEQDFVDSLRVKRTAQKVPPLTATPEQLKAFADKHPVVPAAAPPLAASTVYPPLEPQETKP